MLFQGTDGFHQGPFKIVADAHHLAGGLHLGGQVPLGADKFIKGKAGHLYHAVVQHGLKAGVGFSRNGVFNFIQGIAQGDLGRHLGDGITGSLGRQGGRTAHPGIYLNHAVLKAFGMKGKLHVAAACDFQFADNIQRGGTQHLVLLIPQGLGGSHHDTVSGVHTHRINIFHVADGNHIAGAVPHHLILDLFPSGNTALYQHFSHPA